MTGESSKKVQMHVKYEFLFGSFASVNLVWVLLLGVWDVPMLYLVYTTPDPLCVMVCTVVTFSRWLNKETPWCRMEVFLGPEMEV